MICAIVLAAGRSRRMGAHKVLLPYGGKTVIGHIVDELLASVVDEVFVVAGHRAKNVSEALSDRSVSIVSNPDPDRGMLSSVRCGLKALPRDCEAILVALGDQPAIASGLVDKIVSAFAEKGKGVLVPVHEGRRGHPLLISAQYRDEVLTRYDDVGLRGLLHSHPDDIFELTVSTSSVLSDMDYPEDYRRALANLEKNIEKGSGPQGM